MNKVNFEDFLDPPKTNKVDIRIQPRNRKYLTTVTGLNQQFDFDKILAHLKKKCNCNGHVGADEIFGKVLILQGDHREKIKKFLIEEEICPKEIISIHGF